MSSFDYRNTFDILPGWCFQTVFRPIFFILLKLLFGLKVTGLDNIVQLDSKEPLILAANHSHELDGFMLPASLPITKLPHPIHPVTREPEFYKNKGVRGKIYAHGLLFYIMGAFSAYAGLQNYKASLKNQIELLNDGRMILIFPEGKAQKNRTSPSGGGTGFLSLFTQTPVVPIYFNPPQKSTLLNPYQHSEVIIGKPIFPKKVETEEAAVENAFSFTQEILSKIYALK